MPAPRRYPWASALGLFLGLLGLTFLGLGIWRIVVSNGKPDGYWLTQGSDAVERALAAEVAALEQVATFNQTPWADHPVARAQQEERARAAIQHLRTTVPQYRTAVGVYQGRVVARGYAAELVAGGAGILCGVLLLPTALWLCLVARLRLPE